MECSTTTAGPHVVGIIRLTCSTRTHTLAVEKVGCTSTMKVCVRCGMRTCLEDMTVGGRTTIRVRTCFFIVALLPQRRDDLYIFSLTFEDLFSPSLWQLYFSFVATPFKNAGIFSKVVRLVRAAIPSKMNAPTSSSPFLIAVCLSEVNFAHKERYDEYRT